jgi:hypothetical protein
MIVDRGEIPTIVVPGGMPTIAAQDGILMIVVLVGTQMIAVPVRENVVGPVPNREPKPSVGALRYGLEAAEMPDR